jgi:predicted RNA-binding protein with PUA-like domain
MYWLMKSEPDCFSIDHLAKRPHQTEHWDGVRNYQVRNMMRDQMSAGDNAFFYHSSCNPPGIVGTMEIVRSAYPDFTAFDAANEHFDPKSDPKNPRWLMVDVKLKKQFKKMITLDQLRTHPELEKMLILRKGNRLSVTPVTKQEWEIIMLMADHA